MSAVILEEEVQVARALARDLRRFGLRTIIVHDAAALRAALEAEQPRVFVADHWTSRRQGLAMLEMAKHDFPGITRCIFTGTIHELDAAALERVSPCVTLPKPWSESDILRLIEAIPPKP